MDLYIFIIVFVLIFIVAFFISVLLIKFSFLSSGWAKFEEVDFKPSEIINVPGQIGSSNISMDVGWDTKGIYLRVPDFIEWQENMKFLSWSDIEITYSEQSDFNRRYPSVFYKYCSLYTNIKPKNISLPEIQIEWCIAPEIDIWTGPNKPRLVDRIILGFVITMLASAPLFFGGILIFNYVFKFYHIFILSSFIIIVLLTFYKTFSRPKIIKQQIIDLMDANDKLQ